ncbi:MAG: hypothetical protein MK105_01425 [Crocinitomicaceae bacterium]|nr:hypothetical protein [Crocinitomicaceae bacterium]
MTLNKEDTKIFNTTMIAEKVVDGVQFRLYANRVFHVLLPRLKKIDHKTIQAGYDFLDENGGGKFYNIYQFGSFSDIEPEVREWAADHNGNHYTHTDAIVIESLSQKIITDFYLKFNRPKMPTKIFYNLKKALVWTNLQIEKGTLG